ncbi:MAG: carbon-nitrogen hydrolase family protein [Pseudomonadota bacterium]
MNVTICQIDPREGFLEPCIEKLTDHVHHEKTDFLLLPEMCFSGWLAADQNPDPTRWLQAVDDHARHIANLNDLAAEAVIGTRPIVNDSGSRRNQAYVWSKESGKARGFHEKYYLPDEEGYWEHTWYERGLKEFDTTLINDVRVGVQICTEMWFFEWARHYAKARIDLLCVPRATPHGSTEKWLAGGQAAAVCAGAYCLSSNLWCPSGDKANCGGLSWVIDPEGNVLATTDTDNPFRTVEIDLEFARLSKSTYPRYVPE